MIRGDHFPKHLGANMIVNPDCRDGKHTSCNGQGWDLLLDQFGPCPCPCHDPEPKDGHE